jgi:hypothetical protein
VMKGVKASNGKMLVGINPNFGDTATIDAATCASSVKVICEWLMKDRCEFFADIV